MFLLGAQESELQPRCYTKIYNSFLCRSTSEILSSCFLLSEDLLNERIRKEIRRVKFGGSKEETCLIFLESHTLSSKILTTEQAFLYID